MWQRACLGPSEGIALPPPRRGAAMAHPNEDLVRRAYDAFSRGDVETLRQLFADDTIFHEPGRNPVSGDYQGIDQVLAFSGRSRSVLEGPSGSPCMMLWPATNMVWGCTSRRANGRGAGCRACRRLCSTCVMAGSLRLGRCITISMRLTSSGRRHTRIRRKAGPVRPVTLRPGP